MLDKFVGEFEWRIRQDSLRAFRRAALHQEIDIEIAWARDRNAVVHEIRSDDFMTVGAQDVDDRAATAGRLPDPVRQILGAQQGERRAFRGLVKVVTPIPKRCPCVAGDERTHAACSRSFAFAKAMIRDLTKLETSGVGSSAVRSQ